MGLMCRVLFKKKRLQCMTKTVNLHVQVMQVVSEQVPHRSPVLVQWQRRCEITWRKWRCIGAAPTTSGCVTSCCMPFCTCCTVQWSTAKALPHPLPVAYNTHRPYFMPTAFILGCPSTMSTIAECGGQTPPHSDIIHYLIIRNAEASLVTRPPLSIGPVHGLYNCLQRQVRLRCTVCLSAKNSAVTYTHCFYDHHRYITNRCRISANMGSIFTQTGKGKSY